MKISLAGKLTLAFLLVALTATILVAAAIRLYSGQQLNRLVVEQQRNVLKELLQNYYQEYGSFAGIRENLPHLIGELSGFSALPNQNDSTMIGRSGPGNRPPNRRQDLFGIANPRGTVIIPLMPEFPPQTQLPEDILRQAEPVEVDGQVVAFILTASDPPYFTPAERAFLRRTNSALLFAAGGAALVALIMGLILARTLTRPLRALTEAAENIAHGELEQQVRVESQDEIGQLGAAFNQMSREITHANRMRRQMTADIAHDLRTPLTVIAGYIESMRDGVLPPTQERLELIHSEIDRLQNLVNDLRTLSRADAGELSLNLSPVYPQDLLESAAARYQHQGESQDIELVVESEHGLPEILVDESRMAQVFSNLISNALRYTPRGGRIELAAKQNGDQVELVVSDNGPGISPEDLPHIFNRFYMGDQTRSDKGGESGLGLAITKALVEAQRGTIFVQSTPGKGTHIYMDFPSARAPG